MEHPRPDDKHWTWVLERPCPACRFDARTIARPVIGGTLRTTVEAWREVLSRGALVCQRPPGPAARGPIGIDFQGSVRPIVDTLFDPCCCARPCPSIGLLHSVSQQRYRPLQIGPLLAEVRVRLGPHPGTHAGRP
jgi:hypothetical protein